MDGLTDLRPQRWHVGNVTVTRIEEVIHRVPIQAFIPGADEAVIARHRDWLSPDQVDSEGVMTLPICAFVVESRGRRILVDTCIGTEHEHGAADSPFLHRLERAGFPLYSIDAVVCTHVHFDHVGWNTVVDQHGRRPTFPKADYFFTADEWDFVRRADTAEVLLKSVDAEVRFLVKNRLATLVPSTRELTDEVALLPTRGHTPGHVSILVRSGGMEAVITGDAAHHPIQFAEPDLGTTADDDASQAASTRKEMIDRFLERDSILIGSHFAAPHAGRLRVSESRLIVEPVLPVA